MTPRSFVATWLATWALLGASLVNGEFGIGIVLAPVILTLWAYGKAEDLV